MTTSRVQTNGINLSVTIEGPEDGRPVLLLHGFPDSHRIWRHQVAALTAAGYQTIAADQRGYGESDAPEGADAIRAASSPPAGSSSWRRAGTC